MWRLFVYTAHARCVCVGVRLWVDCAWAGGVCKEGVLVCMHEKCESCMETNVTSWRPKKIRQIQFNLTMLRLVDHLGAIFPNSILLNLFVGCQDCISMCVRTSIHIYVYMYVCMYVYIYLHEYVYMCIYIYMYMYTCIYVLLYINTRAQICVLYIYICIHICVYIYINKYMYIYIHTYIHMYIYIGKHWGKREYHIRVQTL